MIITYLSYYIEKECHGGVTRSDVGAKLYQKQVFTTKHGRILENLKAA